VSFSDIRYSYASSIELKGCLLDDLE